MIFWIGDLNYRIGSYSLEEVKLQIQIQDYTVLITADQVHTGL